MTSEELLEKLKTIQEMKCETQTLELKNASNGCPKRLYDTLSSFSNQDDGGVIVFGIDEESGYKEVGVYDPHDIQKKINEQCLQMDPVVRPLLTVAKKDNKFFVSAEIPGLDLVDRPCHYKGQGRLKGSYTRIGDSDEPMTEYEVYSYEAFRKKNRDDIREIENATFAALSQELLQTYLEKLKKGKPNLATLENENIYELMNLKHKGKLTLCSVLLFSLYPQVFFPQLCITAVVVPGTEMGDMGINKERFLDNERIEGNIPDMLNNAIQFVRKNMRTKTIVNTETGEREDRQDYPILAIREAILNALVHRDYSIHTEGAPIQIVMYDDRMEIINPGGIYGRIKANQLGKIHPYTRNPVIATTLEILGITENRYSGIPTIKNEMKKYNLREPEFIDERNFFIVKFYRDPIKEEKNDNKNDETDKLLVFCKTPRTRKELCDFLGISSISYAMQTKIRPLIEKGLIKQSIPDKPRSSKQLYYSA